MLILLGTIDAVQADLLLLSLVQHDKRIAIRHLNNVRGKFLAWAERRQDSQPGETESPSQQSRTTPSARLNDTGTDT